MILGAGIGIATGRLTAQPASNDLIMRAIPRSGERIPVVGLGSSDTFEVGASAAERGPVRAVLERYVGLGGRVVDTSPMYGTAETVIGDVAEELGIGARLWLATKVWTRGRAAGIEQMEQSFRRLRTDRIDLMQVHNLIDAQTHLRTLRDWKEQGRIRYLGVTHYRVSAYEDGRLFARVRGKPLPEWAAEFDCASWGQFFLKYVISHPAVTCVIPATSKVKHLVDNMGAGRGRLPDAAMRARMVEHFESL
jgi:diketogulonate reductase-like aldo/keto reductase